MESKSQVKPRWLGGVLITLSVLILLIFTGILLKSFFHIDAHAQSSFEMDISDINGQEVKQVIIPAEGTPLEIAYSEAVRYGQYYGLFLLGMLNIILGRISLKKNLTRKTLAIPAIVLGITAILYMPVYLLVLYYEAGAF